MVSVPESFVVNKFFNLAGGPKHNRHQHTYNGSCPICREGTSWLKKKRCYYLPKKNVICCHNCGWYGSPFNWIKEAGNYSISELVQEIKKFDSTEEIVEFKEKKNNPTTVATLPVDSINLFDESECEYWKDNYVLQKAKTVIRDRRLDTAINRPNSLYLSLTDPVHKNRLTIPFYDTAGEIIFYQSRKLLESETKPKYLSKVGQEKTLFGLNNVKIDTDAVFITEGPLDAFFIRNGLAVAGITKSSSFIFTSKQSKQLKELFLFRKIWVLDNQYLDETSRSKTKQLLEAGYEVFIWPDKNYKDINDLCIAKQLNGIDTSFLLENTYTKLKGLIKLAKN
jgi:hypothetical protein